jgi:Cof subfamily protein (haloacid dehalogenase superfamily)
MSADGGAHRRIALVVADVDGTLLDPDKNLTPGAPAAVRRLHQAGIRFTIVSARPLRLTAQLLRDLHVTEPSACFNGALIIDPYGGILHQLPMVPSDAQTVADHITKSELDLWVYTGTDWYVSNPKGPHVQHQEELMQSKATPLPSYDMLQLHVLKLVGVSDDFEGVRRAETELQNLCCVAISATRSSNYYLDVTHAKANKGEVILALSKMLHIPTEQIATIGDMDTDVLMFRKSGVSIAMGNASDEVKAQATFVTKSNQEDGFAFAIEHFIPGAAENKSAAD